MDQFGAKTHIKGSYALTEDELSDHSMSKAYHDLQIIYLQMHTNAY